MSYHSATTSDARPSAQLAFRAGAAFVPANAFVMEDRASWSMMQASDSCSRAHQSDQMLAGLKTELPTGSQAFTKTFCSRLWPCCMRARTFADSLL
jgi:hypothetical protein